MGRLSISERDSINDEIFAEGSSLIRIINKSMGQDLLLKEWIVEWRVRSSRKVLRNWNREKHLGDVATGKQDKEDLIKSRE